MVEVGGKNVDLDSQAEPACGQGSYGHAGGDLRPVPVGKLGSYGSALAELGLTYPQYLTMLVLWESSEPLAVGDIGVRLHLDSGTLTPLLKRLEDLGLATRARDRADERRVLISLTSRGREMRMQAANVPLRVFQRYGIDVETARGLIQDLTKIVDSLQRGA